LSAATRSLRPRFRVAGLDDVEDLVALVESAYRGEASRAGWTTEADLLEGQRTDAAEVTAIIGSARSRILIAEQATELVGCCQLEARPARTAYLGLFAVRPVLQGLGLGRAIVAEAERMASHDLGAERMEMTVIRQRTDIIAWYARLGYEPTGETRPFPYDDPLVGRATRPDLAFVVLSRAIGVAATSSAEIEKM
jgi:GNAT superfamily N-acetyltransferase